PDLNVGVFDVHSGIKPNSLAVSVTNMTTNVTSSLPAPTVGVDGGVFPIDLSRLTAGTRWRIDISVEDNFVGTSGHGNIARLQYTVQL
ncbi:MAG: hypothetical protein JNK78_04390, partial [Planctomycetes bacterium]|nr:hypothetical protein [Planctomycetota bacterium]